jgi:outer membrane murein-binding lipoprotein Lpp
MFRPLRSKIEIMRTVVAVALLGAVLAGCSSSLYSDRRETISPLAGNALAINSATQTIDPWSRASANRNIAYSGEKAQTASERYRTGKVIPPVNATTSSLSYSQASQAAQSAQSNQAAPAASAPVK